MYIIISFRDKVDFNHFISFLISGGSRAPFGGVGKFLKLLKFMTFLLVHPEIFKIIPCWGGGEIQQFSVVMNSLCFL